MRRLMSVATTFFLGEPPLVRLFFLTVKQATYASTPESNPSSVDRDILSTLDQPHYAVHRELPEQVTSYEHTEDSNQ